MHGVALPQLWVFRMTPLPRCWRLYSALPIILITGLMATIYLLRTRAMRRRVATLESLVTAKDEFIGAVSHELRTPLTGIVGFADLLHQAEETLTVPQRAAMVASISEQSHELSSIIEDLLVAARAEIGELTIINVTVDLRAQTPLVLETVQPQLPGIELVGAAPATVVGDPVRVRQILRNLLTNGARYGDGNVQVEYGTTIEHGYVRVRNNGPALPTRTGNEFSNHINVPTTTPAYRALSALGLRSPADSHASWAATSPTTTETTQASSSSPCASPPQPNRRFPTQSSSPPTEQLWTIPGTNAAAGAYQTQRSHGQPVSTHSVVAGR